jgi:hypothetical protein
MFSLSRLQLSLPVFLVAVALGTSGCAGNYPVPNDRMASSEASERGAEEVGALKEPKAALHLKIAQEEIGQAKTLILNGDNKRAEYVLMRAGAEAELALQMAKAVAARADAQLTIDEVQKLKQQPGN